MESGTLSGWKAIATHFGRGERTVRRWATERGMPVHRLPGGSRSPVYGIASELNRWIASAADLDELNERSDVDPQPTNDRPRSRLWSAPANWLALLACLVVVLAVALAPYWRLSAPWHQPDRGVEPDVPPALEGALLQANYDLELRTPRSLRRASTEFETLVTDHPALATAYVGLAQTDLLEREYAGLPEGRAFDQARVAAAAAARLDPRSAPAHRTLAFIAFWRDLDIPRAHAEFARALALAPHDALTRHWYATALSGNGEFNAALEQIKEARRLDPGSSSILADYAMISYLAGDRKQGLRLLQQITIDRPDQLSAFDYLGEFAFERHDYRLALAYKARAASARGDQGAMNDLREARAALSAGGPRALLADLQREAELRVKRSGSGFYQLARLEALEGDGAGSISSLETALDHREVAATSFASDPVFGALTGARQLRRWRDRGSLSI